MGQRSGIPAASNQENDVESLVYHLSQSVIPPLRGRCYLICNKSDAMDFYRLQNNCKVTQQKNAEAPRICHTITNKDWHFLTLSATFQSVPAGPHVGITEVPSAYHVPLFPDTPLLRSI